MEEEEWQTVRVRSPRGMDKLTSSGYERTLPLTAAKATSTGSNQSTLQTAVGKVLQASGVIDSWWLLESKMSLFLRSMVPGRWTNLQWMVPHPWTNGQHKLDYLKHTKEHEVGRRGKAWTWEELGSMGWYNQNTFMHVQISQRINKNHSIKKFPSLNLKT